MIILIYYETKTVTSLTKLKRLKPPFNLVSCFATNLIWLNCITDNMIPQL